MSGNERNTAHPLYQDLERLAVFSRCMEALESGAAEDTIGWPAPRAGFAPAVPLLERADDFLASLDDPNGMVR